MNKTVKRSIVLVVFAAVLMMTGYQHQQQQPHSSRFIKLDNQGQAMHPWHGPWACVYDQHTGLLWENKTDSENIHDGLWTYSWFSSSVSRDIGEANRGDCYFEPDRCDTSDLIRRTNQTGLCGNHEWRLPTTTELLSIVNPNHKVGQASIDNDFFSHTKRGDYWTGDHGMPLSGIFAHLQRGATAVDFITGTSKSLPYRNAAFVRLVATPSQDNDPAKPDSTSANNSDKNNRDRQY